MHPQVEDLEAFLRARGVAPSARDEGTPAETIGEINARMMQAMDKCMTALNLGGLKLQALADAIHTRCALFVPKQALPSCISTGSPAARLRLPHMRLSARPSQISNEALVPACVRRKQLRAHAGHDGERGSYEAARQLNLTPEQIHRGLQYRAHIVLVLERSGPAPCCLTAQIPAESRLVLPANPFSTAADLHPCLSPAYFWFLLYAGSTRSARA